MGREHPSFRDQIEDIDALFPGKLILSIDEGKAVTGIKSDNTYVKHFGKYMPPHTRNVSRVVIAKYMINAL